MLLISTTIRGVAQIADNSLPASFQLNLKAAVLIPESELKAVNADEQIARDRAEGVENRYGVLDSLTVDIRTAGVYSEFGEYKIWRYALKCSDAQSLGIWFKTFDIPEGASLYVYSVDKVTVRGGFTVNNMKEDGQLTLADFKGSSLIVEYNEPMSAVFEGGVVIGGVVKAYQDLAAVAAERIQINCPEGDDWQNEKKAVAMFTFRDGDFSYYCTGGLVNNVREDAIAYFLTANHCVSQESEAQSSVFYFNFENSTCESSDGSMTQSVSGATFVAGNSYSDFSLLKLSEYPPRDFEPYFAGWDASGDIAQNGTCIHHPQGSTKCIALDYSSPESVRYSVSWSDGSVSQAFTHWEASYDDGTDEGGSSGGPLFDQDKRIIGQLHGGDDNSSLFGKFSLSWNYRSETTRQLKHWLDPDNTGILVLDGLDGYTKPVAEFTPDVSIVCLSESIQLNDESKYDPDRWYWEITPNTFSFINGTTSSSQNPQVQFSQEGTYTVSLLVENENGDDLSLQQDLISVYTELPVQFLGVSDEMTLCGWELDEFALVAEGAPEFEFDLTVSENFTFSQSGDSIILSLTADAKTNGSFDTYVKVTGSHGVCSASDSVLLHVVIPDNDNVAQAFPLKLGNNGTFSNECATVEQNEPAPDTEGCSVENNWCPPESDEVLDNSIWFYFEGPSSGRISIRAEGINAQIAVYRAANSDYLLTGSDASYSLIAAADEGLKSANEASIVDLKVTPGANYWLQLDGNDADSGDIKLELLTNSIEVYPNPSSGTYHLTIASEEAGDAELSVFSHTGQLIYSGLESFSPDNNTIDFNLSGNPAGIYYFRAIINGEIMSKKLILLR
ncbi:trypsin-like peptidase domain-containing protein [Mangrovibacterium sp.]|uniref:T9SS type A sorting domain-containing protein n=1 Tax=Mangrovibacterium sp. TaxID=1961364 RepID=UPI00356B2536